MESRAKASKKSYIERNRERSRRISREQNLAARELGALPSVKDPSRRNRARLDLCAFMRSYFPAKFKKPFGPIHYRLIQRIQDVVLNGGKQAVAMPRGSGKTTITNAAAVWAILNGFRRCVVVVAANTRDARRILKTLETMISKTPELLEDYPEVCYPLAKLGGSALLARGQTFYGVPTDVRISADSFRLPTIRGSACSGATIAAFGANAAIRGFQTENPDGSTDRPDFLFLDDLQTDQIAANPARVEALEQKVASTLAGLAENGAELSMIQTMTVKIPDDYADRTLNVELYPRWNGLRESALESLPERLDLWRQYRAIWFDDEKKATAFYRDNLEEMRRGGVVGWPDAYQGGKLVDTLEYYMRLWCENERAFWSEQQNQPKELGGNAVKLPAKEIARKLNGYPRGVLPGGTVKITAFVDVHGDLLYFAVVAFKSDFTGYVVDYGTFPEQRRAYFAKDDGGLETLARAFNGKTADGRVREGLCWLLTDLKSRFYEFEDASNAAGLAIERVGIDAGWKPEIVEDSIRIAGVRFAYPSKGVAVGAKQKPMRLWPKKEGRVFGWRLIDEKVKAISGRQVLVDVNYWKTKVHESLSLTPGESGSLSLWGADRTVHRMFSEHLSAEIAKNVESGTNRVVEWSASPTRPDNHFFDCVVGAFAAASTLGLLTSDDPRAATRRIKM